MNTPTIELKTPAWLKQFEQPSRYKVAHGGRGSGKSWGFAQKIVLRMCERTTRVVCARELQNSIQESVHQLIADTIKRLGLHQYFTITDKYIKCNLNDSEVIFKGLKGVSGDASAIKSLEGADICWIEEAQTITRASLDTLKPTIRKPESEIWITFNPKNESDPVYQDYVLNPPEDAIVAQVNYWDNPHFESTPLYGEMLHLKKTDYKRYLHVWEGQCLIEDVDNNLIKSDDIVFSAQKKSELADQSRAPLIIGVDPARFGKDASAIIRRQGRKAFGLVRFYNQDTMTLAGRCAVIIKAEKPDAMFIDVGGLGAGVYDRLVELGYGDIVKPVNFGGKPIDSDRFYNKRSEMWGLMGDWIKEIPNQIPDDSGLISDLVTPQYSFTSDGRMKLESKDDMKKRLGRSPDVGDALALTFAMPVGARGANKQAEVVVAPFVPMTDVGW